MCSCQGSWATLRLWAARWQISTDHFDPYASRARVARERGRPLDEILVSGSTYARSSLKRRLWAEGLKPRSCELCGQGELRNGRVMGLILDHVNGIRDDSGREEAAVREP